MRVEREYMFESHLFDKYLGVEVKTKGISILKFFLSWEVVSAVEFGIEAPT